MLTHQLQWFYIKLFPHDAISFIKYTTSYYNQVTFSVLSVLRLTSFSRIALNIMMVIILIGVEFIQHSSHADHWKLFTHPLYSLTLGNFELLFPGSHCYMAGEEAGIKPATSRSKAAVETCPLFHALLLLRNDGVDSVEGWDDWISFCQVANVWLWCT